MYSTDVGPWHDEQLFKTLLVVVNNWNEGRQTPRSSLIEKYVVESESMGLIMWGREDAPFGPQTILSNGDTTVVPTRHGMYVIQVYRLGIMHGMFRKIDR